jgi:predicted nuclease of predicted toxin-antitoxin system
MKILVDENIPRITVDALRDLGHDVLDIRGSEDQGLLDPDLWARALGEGRLLITTDWGFADRRYEEHQGILIVRLRQPNRRKIHDRVLRAIAQFSEEEWPGLLVTMRDVVQGVWRPDDSV